MRRLLRYHRPRFRQCEEHSQLCASTTKQSLLLLWRASVLASLLFLLFAPHPAHAVTLSKIHIIWRTQPDPKTQSLVESSLISAHGSPVTEVRLTRLLETTLEHLADLGYRRAVIEPQNFRSANDSVEFDLIVDPGEIARISKWEFAGLRRTDSLWLVNVLDLPTDVPARREAISEAISQLNGFTTLSLDDIPGYIVSTDGTVTVVFRLREQSPARFEGALAAGSPTGADQSLLGRFSLGLNGLFRRGHSLDIQYEHPQPSERLLRLAYSEQYAISRLLTSQFHFEDWRRDDHRQHIGTDLSIGLWRRHHVDLLVGGSWQKVAPLVSSTMPSRLYESTVGLKLGDARSSGISLSGTYSLHRQWARATGSEESRSRLRIESQGRREVDMGHHARLHLSYGARWWGKGEELRAGDEWFLGGDVLSGYAARSIAAADGLWSRLEISRKSANGFGLSVFGDQAWLRLFDDSYTRPATLGLALLLDSQGRSGRLELAWKDRASLRDGILRLSVIQDW